MTSVHAEGKVRCGRGVTLGSSHFASVHWQEVHMIAINPQPEFATESNKAFIARMLGKEKRLEDVPDLLDPNLVL